MRKQWGMDICAQAHYSPVMRSQVFSLYIIRELFYWILQCRIYLKRQDFNEPRHMWTTLCWRTNAIQRGYFGYFSSNTQQCIVSIGNDWFCWWRFWKTLFFLFFKYSGFQHEYFPWKMAWVSLPIMWKLERNRPQIWGVMLKYTGPWFCSC